MSDKEERDRKEMAKQVKWKYVTKPALIIFGTLNFVILIFFIVNFYRWSLMLQLFVNVINEEMLTIANYVETIWANLISVTFNECLAKQFLAT